MKHIFHDDKMSEDGVGAKADHEGMRKQSRLIFCYLYKNLVVIGEMVDVD